MASPCDCVRHEGLADTPASAEGQRCRDRLRVRRFDLERAERRLRRCRNAVDRDKHESCARRVPWTTTVFNAASATDGCFYHASQIVDKHSFTASNLNSTMNRKLTKVDYCFYIDEKRNVYFSVSDFFDVHQLPDAPELRRVVAEEMKDIYPEIVILEEEN